MVVFEQEPPNNWDEMVILAGGTIYHSKAYARYYGLSQPQATPVYLLLKNDAGVIIGVALAFIEKPKNKIKSFFSAKAYLPTFPAIASGYEDIILTFLCEIEEFALQKGCSEIILDSFAAGGKKLYLEKNAYNLIERFEFELDLTQSEDILWNTIEHKRRKNINKAIKLGVKLIDMNDEKGISNLRHLQAESSIRIVRRGGRSIVRNHINNQDPIKALLNDGVARIVCAKVEGEIVSAGLFTFFNRIVYHTLSGHSRIALKSQAPTLLLWEVINQYHELGAKSFNFGGCKVSAEQEGDPEYGVYSYKMGFGSKRLLCTSGVKVLQPLRKFIYDNLSKK